MAMTSVQQILYNGEDLVPWIEESAFQYAMHRFTMANRVLTLSDMPGSWNVRKVSEYSKQRMAQELDENTQIPEAIMVRKRKSTIEPLEWGDRYPVTNRRTGTDPEPVLRDTVSALGYSLGRRKEKQLFDAALNSFTGGTLGSTSSAYSLDLAIAAQAVFASRALEGELFHVIHPFQELAVMKELIDLSNPAVPEFRNRFIRSWDFGGFGGLNIAVATLLPRKVLHRLVFAGITSGNFKLQWNSGDQITANIAYNSTPATLASNIQTALNAVSGSSGWVVTAPTSNVNNIQVQAPYYLDAENELTFGKTAEDVFDETFDAGTLTIQEVSAVARSLIFEREALIHDARQGVKVEREWKPSYRTLDIMGYEVYGVGGWRPERGMFIDSDCTSPVAVA